MTSWANPSFEQTQRDAKELVKMWQIDRLEQVQFFSTKIGFGWACFLADEWGSKVRSLWRGIWESMLQEQLQKRCAMNLEITLFYMKNKDRRKTSGGKWVTSFHNRSDNCHVLWTAGNSCKTVWYCRRQCQIEHWAEHKKICDMLKQS